MEPRRWSLSLFGHAQRLQLLSAFTTADDDGVVIGDLAKQVGVSASVFYPPLHALEGLGLVASGGRSADSRRVPYLRTDSSTWEPLGNLVQHLLDRGDGELRTAR